MAKKTRRRRRKPSGTAPKKRRSVHRAVMSARGTRRKKTRKKGFLSEFFSPTGFKEGAKAAANGAIGGGAGAILDRILPGDNELVRFIAHAGGAVMIGGGLGYKNMGAGMAGYYAGTTVDRIATKILSEMQDNDYADDDVLEEYPDALDEDNTPLCLAEDGNFYYMEDFELADDGEMYLSEDAMAYLSETFQANDMYPRYTNTSQF